MASVPRSGLSSTEIYWKVTEDVCGQFEDMFKVGSHVAVLSEQLSNQPGRQARETNRFTAPGPQEQPKAGSVGPWFGQTSPNHFGLLGIPAPQNQLNLKTNQQAINLLPLGPLNLWQPDVYSTIAVPNHRPVWRSVILHNPIMTGRFF